MKRFLRLIVQLHEVTRVYLLSWPIECGTPRRKDLIVFGNEDRCFGGQVYVTKDICLEVKPGEVCFVVHCGLTGHGADASRWFEQFEEALDHSGLRVTKE
jgi:hypothetical protein